MTGRNGKQVISDEQINRVELLLAGKHSIRSAAEAAKVAYSTAWRIKNGFFNADNRMMKPKRKQQSEFFEHDKYYI